MWQKEEQPNVAYFNQVFSEVWRIFLSHEQVALREQEGTNMAMSTYLKSGLLGWLSGKMTMQFELTAKPEAWVFTTEGKNNAAGKSQTFGTWGFGQRIGFNPLRWRNLLRDRNEKVVSEGETILKSWKSWNLTYLLQAHQHRYSPSMLFTWLRNM
jgi:hypothetical protein